MEDILSGNGEKPDAIFAFNDPVAIGAMKALKRHGLRIPYDVAFVGFSESDMATVVEPYLTSIDSRVSKSERLQQAACWTRFVQIDCSIKKLYWMPN